MKYNYPKHNQQSLNKKPYQTPKIKIYGKVEEITYGEAGSGFDGAINNSRIPR